MNIENFLFEISLPQMEFKSGGVHARCIICGDSEKSQSKKRFWIKKNGYGNYYAHCFNCGYHKSFKLFLKENFPEIYKSYVKLNFKNKHKPIESKPEEVKKIVEVDMDLIRVVNLPDNHIAHSFFTDRKIHNRWKKYLFYTDNFQKWINSKVKTFEYEPKYDRRIVLPFYSIDKKLIGAAGRSLEKDSKLRYITIKFDENHPKIFGLERVKFDKPVYVFEGQIDSLFIPNSLAMAGSISGLMKLLDYAPIDTYILVPDIEPRNKEIVNFIEQSLKKGFKVSLLPERLKIYGKDLNDLVLKSNLNIKEIYNMINENVIQGKLGLIKFNIWKKI